MSEETEQKQSHSAWVTSTRAEIKRLDTDVQAIMDEAINKVKPMNDRLTQLEDLIAGEPKPGPVKGSKREPKIHAITDLLNVPSDPPPLIIGKDGEIFTAILGSAEGMGKTEKEAVHSLWLNLGERWPESMSQSDREKTEGILNPQE